MTKRLAVIVTISAMAFGVGVYSAPNDPISVAGCKVNGQPVVMFLDTGSGATFLFRHAAERLGLKTTYSSSRETNSSSIPFGLTEDCIFTSGGIPAVVRLPVLDDYPGVPQNFDGLVGWPSCSNFVFQLDPELRAYGVYSNVTMDVIGWRKWKLVKDSALVEFDTSDGRRTMRIGIDSGSGHGVWLRSDRWREWRAKRLDAPATLEAGFSESGALEVKEVLRARKIELGGIILREIPVTTPDARIGAIFGQCDAVLGLWALSQLRIILDGKNSFIYTKPTSSATDELPRYPYNLLRATFAPNRATEDGLVAHVIQGGPAYQAGIREGDLLLKVDVFNVTRWRSDPYFLPGRFWREPPGTKQTLTLKHGDKVYETTVTLEELPAVE
jgi:hypothetical protein